MSRRIALLGLMVFVLAGCDKKSTAPLPIFSSHHWSQTAGPEAQVNALAIHGSTWFAGTPGAGVYRSADGGVTWINASTGLGSLDVRALAVAGTTLLAGTSAGVYLSTNDGARWQSIQGSMNTDVRALLVDPRGEAFAGTRGGVFRARTATHFATWDATPLIAPVDFLASTYEPAVYAVGLGALHRSDTEGETWEPLSTRGLPGTFRTAFTASDTVLYLGQSATGVFRTAYWNDTWTFSGNGSGYDVKTLFWDGRGHVFASSSLGTKRLDEGASSWTDAGVGLPVGDRVVAFAALPAGILDPVRELLAGDERSGVYRSSNDGDTWTRTGSGIVSSAAMDLVSNGRTLVAGSGRRDGAALLAFTTRVFSSADDGAHWMEPNAFFIAGSIGVSGTTYLAGVDGGVYRSIDDGETWIPGGPLPFPHSFATVGDTVYAATIGGGVYRSGDDGVSWTQAGTLPTMAGALVAKGAVLFAGAPNGVYRSMDRAATWTPVNNGLSNRDVRVLAVRDAALLAGTAAGAFRSNDNGETWVDAGLSGLAVQALAIHGTRVFAGTSEGAFVSTSDGASWSSFSDDLANIDVRSLAVRGTWLFAGTFGSGVWRVAL